MGHENVCAPRPWPHECVRHDTRPVEIRAIRFVVRPRPVRELCRTAAGAGRMSHPCGWSPWTPLAAVLKADPRKQVSSALFRPRCRRPYPSLPVSMDLQQRFDGFDLHHIVTGVRVHDLGAIGPRATGLFRLVQASIRSLDQMHGLIFCKTIVDYRRPD